MSLTVAIIAGAAEMPCHAQVPAPAIEREYRDEIFRYDMIGSADPFRPPEGPIRPTNSGSVSLIGVILHESPTRSLAVLSSIGSPRPIHARVGQRIGTLTVLEIRPNEVDVMIESSGSISHQTLKVESTPPSSGASR